MSLDQCYLCKEISGIKQEADGYFVNCPGSCGPYLITPKGLIDLDRVKGRRYDVVKYLKELRQKDKDHRIIIDSNSVSFSSY